MAETPHHPSNVVDINLLAIAALVAVVPVFVELEADAGTLFVGVRVCFVD
jgi:hypothetical protein